jgi:hypothetical protein
MTFFSIFTQKKRKNIRKKTPPSLTDRKRKRGRTYVRTKDEREKKRKKKKGKIAPLSPEGLLRN